MQWQLGKRAKIIRDVLSIPGIILALISQINWAWVMHNILLITGLSLLGAAACVQIYGMYDMWKKNFDKLDEVIEDLEALKKQYKSRHDNFDNYLTVHRQNIIKILPKLNKLLESEGIPPLEEYTIEDLEMNK